MKKLALLNRIEKLEAELYALRLQVAGMRAPVPVVTPWTAPYPNLPPYVGPSTTPWNTYVPPITICEATRAQ